MQLNDKLRICLLALAERYPMHVVVDFADNLTDLPEAEARGWTVQEMIEYLESYAPQLLEAPASLHLDEDESDILVPMYSEDRPAIYVHRQGKIPTPHRHLFPRKISQA